MLWCFSYSIASLASMIFCLQRALVASQVEVAHQLHRDRRAALQRGAVEDVLHGRAEDPGQVDAVVLVEALVLDRDRGVLQVCGDFAPGDGAAQLVGLDEAQPRAVGGEHLRGAAAQDRVQLCDRGSRPGDAQDVADRRDRAHDHYRGEHRRRRRAVNRAGPLRLCLRRRCRACLDISEEAEITARSVISCHLRCSADPRARRQTT